MSRQQGELIPKRCEKCGFNLAYFAKQWEGMEWANGKWFPTKHRGCGGDFVSLVSKIGRAS